MTSEKQLIANQQNAQLSTGPVTALGKTTISTNAIKHGIFTQDLIISSGPGRENRKEYEELLDNLISSLSPRNQMECLLVEKIAVDFWRLRRTMRFESTSISKCIDEMIKSRYSHTYDTPDNEKLDRDLAYKRRRIDWNEAYLKCLEKCEVRFDQPVWKGETVESDILDDLTRIIRDFSDLTKAESQQIYDGKLTLQELTAMVVKRGCATIEEMSIRLIEIYIKDNERLKGEIKTLEEQKTVNQEEDRRNSMIGLAPPDESTEKVLKYERSLQKSIFQNLFLLKKLQEATYNP